MNRLPLLLPLTAILASSPALAGQSAPPSIAVCATAAAFMMGGEAPDLVGQWDFVMTVDATPVRGVMAIGLLNGAYMGALTPEPTNTVIIRRLSFEDGVVRMSVASRDPDMEDVLFDGRLAGGGDMMCGTVTYHDGRRFPMAATQRPNSYVFRPRP